MIDGHRWANGDKEALSLSAAYPRAFGRAFLFAHRCLMNNLSEGDIAAACIDFAQRIVDDLPPVGQLADEAWFDIQILGAKINLTSFFQAHKKTCLKFFFPRLPVKCL